MPKRHSRFELILGLALLLPAAATADVFKCVSDDGQITFSQTPCPPKVSEAPPPQTEEVDSATRAENNPELVAHTPPAPRKLAPAVAEARARAAEEHEELNRRRCEANLQAQIDNINSQMHDDFAPALGEALRKKRSSLQARLGDC